MKAIVRNWKALLAIVLVLAAAAVYFLGYRPSAENFARQREQLTQQNAQLQTTIAENERYKDVQDQLSPALDAIEESRQALYDAFPDGMREEDQLLYLLYLDETIGAGDKELGYNQELHELFLDQFGAGTDIEFTFGSAAPIQFMSDGAILEGLNITVYYHASYAEFKEMVQALATDERIASIQYATFSYDSSEKKLTGQMTLTIYLMQTLEDGYEEPAVTVPDTGKTDIFS